MWMRVCMDVRESRLLYIIIYIEGNPTGKQNCKVLHNQCMIFCETFIK